MVLEERWKYIKEELDGPMMRMKVPHFFSPKFSSNLKFSYGSSKWSMAWNGLSNVASRSEWPTLMKLLMARQIRWMSKWSWSISASKSTWDRRRKNWEKPSCWKMNFRGFLGVFDAKKLVLRIMFRRQQQVMGSFWKTKFECQKAFIIN